MLPKEDWVSPKIEIKETPDKGKGMFALKLIPESETVLKWGGTYVNKEAALQAKEAGKLVMQFDEDLFSIEDRGESEAYFINHSCDPNVWMSDAFTLVAMRDIAPGEELTADYALWETDEDKISKWECRCGSNNCRHRVTGKDWQLSYIQEKYRGHFLPLIDKRINQ